MTLPLGYLRGLNESYMPESAAISRPTNGTPTGDGTPVSWSTVATVAARLSPAGGGDESLVAEALRSKTLWRIALPAGTDVRATDRVVISGRTFEVAAALTGRSYATQATVIAAEVL